MTVHFKIGYIGIRMFSVALGNSDWIKHLLLKLIVWVIYLVPMKDLEITSLMVHFMESRKKGNVHINLDGSLDVISPGQ